MEALGAGAGLPPGKRKRYANPEEAFIACTEWRGDCLVWTRPLTSKGYGYLRADGKDKRVHRYAWERERGPIPEGMFVDHVCHNRACVSVEHLRLATPGENSRNRRGARADSGTGVRGVTRTPYGFMVRVMFEGVFYGHFHSNLADAASEAAGLRADLYGEFAEKEEDAGALAPHA